jgi:hypothetical protein
MVIKQSIWRLDFTGFLVSSHFSHMRCHVSFTCAPQVQRPTQRSFNLPFITIRPAAVTVLIGLFVLVCFASTSTMRILYRPITVKDTTVEFDEGGKITYCKEEEVL